MLRQLSKEIKRTYQELGPFMFIWALVDILVGLLAVSYIVYRFG